MADDLRFSVRGLDDVKAALRAIAPKLRRRVLMNALRAAGRVFRDEARRLTPTLRVPAIVRGRQVRTSKRARRAGDLGVFVNVRPASRGQRGANSPRDPFYWRWLEFGARGRPGHQMLQRALGKAAESVRRFGDVLGPAIAKLNRRDVP